MKAIRNAIKRVLFTTILVAGLMLGSSKSKAYQYETHFLEIYAMMIHAGIHPAIAERIAAYDQWVDVSTLNSAMNPIPFVHARVSRLLHFPADGVDPIAELAKKVIAKVKPGVNPHGHSDMENIFNSAQRDSFIANEIFNEALKTGNEFLIGAAFHTLKDSFAHEGFIYTIGHGARGSYPDRPWMFQEKHNEMRKLLFKAIRRLAQSLPDNGLTEIKVNDLGKPNRYLTPEQLFESYSSNPSIVAATKANPHRDPLYTASGISMIVDRLVEEGVATQNLKSYIATKLKYLFFRPAVTGGELRSGQEVLKAVVEHVFSLNSEVRKELLNDAKVMEHYGNIPENYELTDKFGKTVVISGSQARERMTDSILINSLVKELTKHGFPAPALGDSANEEGAKVTFEFSKIAKNLYETEEKLQEARWQDVFVKVYNSQPLVLDQRKMATKLVLWLKNAVGADGEKLQNDLEKMNRELARSSKFVKVSMRERAVFMWSLFKYTLLDATTYRVTQLLVWLKIMDRTRGNLRLTAADVKDAKLWQDDDLFAELRNKQVFQDIYSEKAVNRLIEKWEKVESKFAEQLKAINRHAGQEASALSRLQMQTPNALLGSPELRAAQHRGFLQSSAAVARGSNENKNAISCFMLL